MDDIREVARRVNATPAGYGLWYLPGYPELTSSQLRQVAGTGERSITVYSIAEALIQKGRP